MRYAFCRCEGGSNLQQQLRYNVTLRIITGPPWEAKYEGVMAFPARSEWSCVEINSELVVQFKIESSKPWASCGASGSLVNLTSYGYDGQIVCPDSGAMCLQATQIVNLTGTFASRQESFCTAPTREAGGPGTESGGSGLESGLGSGIATMPSVIP